MSALRIDYITSIMEYRRRGGGEGGGDFVK